MECKHVPHSLAALSLGGRKRCKVNSWGKRLCCFTVLLLLTQVGTIARSNDFFFGSDISFVYFLEGAGFLEGDLHAGLVLARGFGVRLSAGVVHFADPVTHVQLDIRYQFPVFDDVTRAYVGMGPDVFIGDKIVPLAHVSAGLERHSGQIGLFGEVQFNWIYPSLRVGFNYYSGSRID